MLSLPRSLVFSGNRVLFNRGGSGLRADTRLLALTPLLTKKLSPDKLFKFPPKNMFLGISEVNFVINTERECRR